MHACPACDQFASSDPTHSSVESLLAALSVATRTRRLLYIDGNWDGCSGCSNFELGQAIFSDRFQFQVVAGSVSWKAGAEPSLPVLKEFKLFTEMVGGHQQAFGAEELVESYSVPPWDRPHFPQLFLLDGRLVDAPSLDALCALHSTGQLFDRNDELNLDDVRVRLAVYRTLRHGAVLLQLLNEHLFAVPNDQFQEPPFWATFDCIVSQFRARPSDPESCFRYTRSPSLPRGEHAI